MDKGVRDVFVKISNVFKDDIYLVHNKYFIGGKESEDKNRVFYYAEINPPTQTLLGLDFDESFCYKIESLKDFKKYETTCSKVKATEDEILAMRLSSMEELMSEIIENAGSFSPLFENCAHPEDVFDMFGENRVIAFDVSDEDGSHTVYLGKDIFPLITKTTTKNVMYHTGYDEGTKLFKLLFSYDTKYFTVHGIAYYVDLDSEIELIRG